MTDRIQKLSEKTKRILKLASCIGNRFDLDTLAIINEKTAVETANEMNEALESGLIQPIGEGYRLAGYLDFLNDNTSLRGLSIRFSISSCTTGSIRQHTLLWAMSIRVFI